MAVATVQWWTYHMENQALLSKVLLPFDTRIAESHARARAYYEEQRPHFEVAAKRFHLHQHFVDTARNFSETDTTYYDLSEKRLRAMASLLKVTGRDDFLIEKSKRACHSRNKGPRSAVTSGLPPGRRALCGRLGAEPLLPRLPRLPRLLSLSCRRPRRRPRRRRHLPARLPNPRPPTPPTRCVMSSFFERNQLPMVAILRNWTDHRNFTADMRSGAAVRDVTTWPIFIKFCHLTQGSARSVRRAARPCRPFLPLPPYAPYQHPAPTHHHPIHPPPPAHPPPPTAHCARCAPCHRPSGLPTTSRSSRVG